MECCAFHNYGWCAILKHISKLKSSLLNVTNGILEFKKTIKEILPHEVCCKDHKRCKRFLHFLHVSIVSFGWFCNWSKLFLRAYLLTENWKKIILIAFLHLRYEMSYIYWNEMMENSSSSFTLKCHFLSSCQNEILPWSNFNYSKWSLEWEEEQQVIS